MLGQYHRMLESTCLGLMMAADRNECEEIDLEDRFECKEYLKVDE